MPTFLLGTKYIDDIKTFIENCFEHTVRSGFKETVNLNFVWKPGTFGNKHTKTSNTRRLRCGQLWQDN